MLDLREVQDVVAQHGAVIRVVMARVSGSTPRGAGTSMLVWSQGQSGTIGGGHLEYQATTMAREMLKQKKSHRVQRVPLGPSLGQCCGGSVTLVYEYLDAARVDEIPSQVEGRYWQRPVVVPIPAKPANLREPNHGGSALVDGWLAEQVKTPPHAICIYGAGHVGRALAPLLAGIPGMAVTVFDPRDDQAALMPDHVPCVTSLSWERAALSAPPSSAHFIMTPEHDVDLALCHQILRRDDFTYAGLIGSATKWARFRKRLMALGHTDAEINRIACPIGDPALGKHPHAIAIGVAAALLKDHAAHGAQGNNTE